MDIDPLIPVRGVHFAATVLVTGTVGFMTLVVDPAFHGSSGLSDYSVLRRRLTWLTAAALIAVVLSGAAWLALVASDILGVPLAEVSLHGGILTVATETRFGEIACARLLIAIALGLLLPWSSLRWARLAASAALIGLIALTGHAGATPGAAGLVHLTSDLVHLIAAGAWLGALPALAMLLAWAGPDAARGRLAADATRRFSVVGMACVAALAASGLINSLELLAGPGDLLHTAYGRLLALKIGLFAAMVAIAAVNRTTLSARLPERNAARALMRNTIAETGLGLAVLFVAGALGIMAPSGHVHSSSAEIPPEAAFVHIHTEQVMADVTINPGHAGKTTATIRLSREDFTQFSAKHVRLALDPPDASHKTIEGAAAQMPDGTWEIIHLNIPAAGIWTARVIVDAGTAQPIVLDAPIVITQCSNEC